MSPACRTLVATLALPHVQAGKVRALDVTSAKRSKVLPEVPGPARGRDRRMDHPPDTPEQFATFGRNELPKWQKVVKDGNVKPE